MTYLATNLKVLIEHRKRSQEVVALAVGIKRTTLSGYICGRSTPNLDTLVALSTYFRVSVDRLLRQDLRCLSQFRLGQLLRGHDHLRYVNGHLDPEP